MQHRSGGHETLGENLCRIQSQRRFVSASYAVTDTRFDSLYHLLYAFPILSQRIHKTLCTVWEPLPSPLSNELRHQVLCQNIKFNKRTICIQITVYISNVTSKYRRHRLHTSALVIVSISQRAHTCRKFNQITLTIGAIMKGNL